MLPKLLLSFVALSLVHQEICLAFESNFIDEDDEMSICQRRYNVTRREATNYFYYKNHHQSGNTEGNTEQILCYLKCYLEERRIINEDGSISRDYIIKRVKQIKESRHRPQETDFECVETMKPIVTCNDADVLIDCLRKLTL